MMTEVPAALRRHMYDQIRIVETKRRTVVNGLAEQVKFALLPPAPGTLSQNASAAHWATNTGE